MDFDEVIEKRQTIRKYTNEKVDEVMIEKILNAARLAPSAKNRQPWRFYVLSDEEKRNIVEIMYEWERNNVKEKTSVKGTANQMRDASKVIMVYRLKYKNKYKKIYYKKPDYLSIGAAIENLILKCTEMGLGSCWCCDTLYMDEEIDKYLGMEKYEQISSILIGYPREVTEKAIKKSLKEIVIKKEE